jgi:hypothetical protein
MKCATSCCSMTCDLFATIVSSRGRVCPRRMPNALEHPSSTFGKPSPRAECRRRLNEWPLNDLRNMPHQSAARTQRKAERASLCASNPAKTLAEIGFCPPLRMFPASFHANRNADGLLTRMASSPAHSPWQNGTLRPVQALCNWLTGRPTCCLCSSPSLC